MLKIYAIPVSLYCAKLRILLRHKQLEWVEAPPPGGYGSKEYKKLVPGGNLPALDHNGLLISDSEAIAEYLNEVYPQPDMLPGTAGDRAIIRNLSRFHDTRLEPALRQLFPKIGIGEEYKAFVAQQWQVLKVRLEETERLLPEKSRPLTLADCGLPITCTWIELLTDHFSQPPIINDVLRAYLDRVHQIEAVRIELTEYRPRLLDWLASK